MRLHEVQVICAEGASAIRRQFAATAAVVEAAFEDALSDAETGGSRKIAISLWDTIPDRYERISASPPDGRGGDDVDLMNLPFEGEAKSRPKARPRRGLCWLTRCDAAGGAKDFQS